MYNVNVFSENTKVSYSSPRSQNSQTHQPVSVTTLLKRLTIFLVKELESRASTKKSICLAAVLTQFFKSTDGVGKRVPFIPTKRVPKRGTGSSRKKNPRVPHSVAGAAGQWLAVVL